MKNKMYLFAFLNLILILPALGVGIKYYYEKEAEESLFVTHELYPISGEMQLNEDISPGVGGVFNHPLMSRDARIIYIMLLLTLVILRPVRRRRQSVRTPAQSRVRRHSGLRKL